MVLPGAICVSAASRVVGLDMVPGLDTLPFDATYKSPSASVVEIADESCALAASSEREEEGALDDVSA
ncbi:UNVERIFIED_CONTAM: hypothetical protein ABIC26_000317 [Paenibacillus sp. PvR008]